MTHLSTVPSILHFNKFPFTKRRLLPSLNCTGEFVEDFPCDYTFCIIPVQESHCRSFLKHRIFFPKDAVCQVWLGDFGNFYDMQHIFRIIYFTIIPPFQDGVTLHLYNIQLDPRTLCAKFG